MEEQAPTTKLPAHNATCDVDGSCTSFSSCSTGLCHGTILVAAIALVWMVVAIGAKLFGKKTPTNDG